jgi:hypothetical protein
MKAISYFFFYAYIGTVVFAGFWGAFINPEYDHQLLFHIDVHQLSDSSRINLLSQYRFLRALELGFGIFSLLFVRLIFTVRKYNLLYLIIMALGVLARIFSLIFDGSPDKIFYIFLIFELLGIIFIFRYTNKLIRMYAIQ